jgi:hypothetical protein
VVEATTVVLVRRCPGETTGSLEESPRKSSSPERKCRYIYYRSKANKVHPNPSMDLRRGRGAGEPYSERKGMVPLDGNRKGPARSERTTGEASGGGSLRTSFMRE